MTPKQVSPAADWAAVYAGNGAHTCAVRTVGKLYCWGFNGTGQSSTSGGTSNPVLVTRQITSATDWTVPSAGSGHSCAIRAGGKLFCWGYNGSGQLGLGSKSNTAYPTQVTSTSGQPGA